MQSPQSTSGNTVIRLSIMMFLQFFLWGAWFVSLGQCLGEHKFSGDVIGGAYGTAPIAAIFAPLFLGLIADRLFASQKVMGVLFLLGAVFMWLAHGAAVAGNGSQLVWYFTGHMLCYMPTLGLGNSVAFANIHDPNLFPKVRVWGTIGWIVAGLVVGFKGWSADFAIFKLAAICSLALGVYSFTLPNTPPPAKDKPFDIKSLLMVDAFRLLAKPAFLIFVICSTLICIPLAYYYGLTSNYLGTVGFAAPASSMSIGQMSEIFFMILIPFFLRRLGVKYMIAVGMLAWATRYALFAYGAPGQIYWMLFLAIALHGVCYDFFFVTGFMYTDRTSPHDVRGQAQSMLVFFTQGIGMYFGYKVAFAKFGETVTKYGALTDAVKASRPEESLSFAQSLGKMFSAAKPKVEAVLLSDTMAQWKTLWILPAIMAAVILVIFFAAFHDKVKVDEPAD
ncbi:MAG: MFS transporter [Kiritimatiellia bacterium]